MSNGKRRILDHDVLQRPFPIKPNIQEQSRNGPVFNFEQMQPRTTAATVAQTLMSPSEISPPKVPTQPIPFNPAFIGILQRIFPQLDKEILIQEMKLCSNDLTATVDHVLSKYRGIHKELDFSDRKSPHGHGESKNTQEERADSSPRSHASNPSPRPSSPKCSPRPPPLQPVSVNHVTRGHANVQDNVSTSGIIERRNSEGDSVSQQLESVAQRLSMNAHSDLSHPVFHTGNIKQENRTSPPARSRNSPVITMHSVSEVRSNYIANIRRELADNKKNMMRQDIVVPSVTRSYPIPAVNTSMAINEKTIIDVPCGKTECKLCHSKISVSDRFCGGCGARVSPGPVMLGR